MAKILLPYRDKAMTESNAVAIACDHAGFRLKETLKAALIARGQQAADLGTYDDKSVDYPDYAHALADWMEAHPGGKGLLICGSGIGMSIAANRHAHIRAALVSDVEAAKLARLHNDANVLCLGARAMDEASAKACMEEFLVTEFEGGRHQARVEKL